MACIEIIDDVVLLHVFSYLPISDLISCSLVCKHWNQLAKEELENSRNRQIQTFLFLSENWIHKKSTVNISRSAFTNEFTPERNKIFTNAQFCILLSTKNLFKSLIEEDDNQTANESIEFRRSKRIKPNEKSSSRLIKELPKVFNINDSQFVHIFSYGFIGTNAPKTKTVEIESYHDESGFGGILFPRSDAFRFKAVSLSVEEASKIKSACEFQKLFKVNESNEFIKWVLVLSKNDRINKHLSEMRSIQRKLDFACSGGIPDRFFQKFGKIRNCLYFVWVKNHGV